MKRIALSLFLLVILTSCNNVIGYGVVLWNNNNQDIANGALLSIIRESKVYDSFTFSNKETNLAADFQLPRNMVSVFKTLNHAKSFQEQYGENINRFVRCENSSGLFMREEADVNSRQVYKLYPQQVVKVLEKLSEEVSIGQFTGHWYKLLTPEGVIGYTFDYYLAVFDLGADASQSIIKETVNSADKIDNNLRDLILENTWYPEDFLQESQQENVDLRYFSKNMGLSFDLARQVLIYKIEPLNFVRPYSKIISSGKTNFDFVGADLEVRVLSNTRIKIQLLVDGQDLIKDLVFINSNEISRFKNNLIERQSKKISNFLNRGHIFTATSVYGSVSIYDDATFNWENRTGLIEQNVLSREASRFGSIHFYELPADLADSYDGIIAFNFDNSAKSLLFLYLFNKATVTLSYLSNKDFNDIDISLITGNSFQIKFIIQD